MTALPRTAWIQALDSKAPKSTPGNPASPATHVPGDELSKRIVCLACGHSITHADARIERGGAHIHTRLNPEKVTFVFGCFTEAPGAVVSGDSTDFFTWFHGYAWRIASCGGCKAHLGWLFEGEKPFYALILDRLTGG